MVSDEEWPSALRLIWLIKAKNEHTNDLLLECQGQCKKGGASPLRIPLVFVGTASSEFALFWLLAFRRALLRSLLTFRLFLWSHFEHFRKGATGAAIEDTALCGAFSFSEQLTIRHPGISALQPPSISTMAM